MLHPIVSSFLLVAASEMGDKTQLLAFSLAARFKKPWPIMAGIFTATVLNHALAAYAGGWIASMVSRRTLATILGASFIIFGLWTLKPDTHEDSEKPHVWGAYLTTTVLFFFAEMGDKTQLATVALGAQFATPVAVTMGTTLGMMLSDGLAVWVGETLAERVNMKWVRAGAAGLFFIFGALALLSK